MGEAVSCGCKDVGDAGVNSGIIAGVAAKLSAHCIGANDVRQIVSEHKQLRETESFNLSKYEQMLANIKADSEV